MSSDPHAQLRHELGVYVLGALEPSERERVEAHLSGCADCRDEVARLAVLPSLLLRVSSADGTPPPGGAGPPAFEPVVRRIVERRRQDRRRWLALAVAAVLAAVAVTAATTVVVLSPQGAPSPVAAEVQRYAAEGGAAVAAVQPRAWGMSVRIDAHQLPPGPGYTAVAVADDGHRTQVASWTDVGHPVTVDGSCYLAAEELRHLEILAAPGDEVLAVLQPTTG